jgi:hypothetical protein
MARDCLCFVSFLILVRQERVADEEVLFVRGTLHPHSCSLLFRGPNTTMLDEMERAMHDALCAVARTLESGHVVAGGGERKREREEQVLTLFSSRCGGDCAQHLH